MMMKCKSCGEMYDDARRFTFCPHDEFISEDIAARKDRACELAGKKLRFRSSRTRCEISAVASNGMVMLKGWSYALFSPDLFEVVDE